MEGPRFWIGVASRDHVLLGVAGGFCQLGHGKRSPVQALHPGDILLYYSSRESYPDGPPCRRFTALGRIAEGEVYSVLMNDRFAPFRRNVEYEQVRETAIEPLIGQLSFIHDPRHWGYPFRRGHFRIEREDFLLIAREMVGNERAVALLEKP